MKPTLLSHKFLATSLFAVGITTAINAAQSEPIMSSALKLDSASIISSASSVPFLSPMMVEDSNKGEKYHPVDDPMAVVDQTLSRAMANGKKALVILGANWCHDSRGLAARVDEPEMAKVIEENYEMVFIDVGPLKNGKDITRRFGLPIFYATPTVLVIDPKTETLVNADDMHQWRNADRISLEDSVDYFNRMADRNVADYMRHKDTSTDPELKALMDQIDAFEAQHVARIEKGYEIVGKMVAMPADERPDELGTYWGQVRKLRWTFPEDMAALRKDVRDRFAAGERDIKIKLPSFETYDWEKASDE